MQRLHLLDCFAHHCQVVCQDHHHQAGHHQVLQEDWPITITAIITIGVVSTTKVISGGLIGVVLVGCGVGCYTSSECNFCVGSSIHGVPGCMSSCSSSHGKKIEGVSLNILLEID